MPLPQFSMRQLLEAGCHFGHQTHRWNPKMDRYIYGDRSGIHIMDLSKTMPLLEQALLKIREVAAKGGRVLFVGTKKQASDPIAEAAQRCAQYYINHRWLGGALTNWKTISNSISRLRKLEALLKDPAAMDGLTKKELLQREREREKLERSLGGIKDMGGVPDIIFVIDTLKEKIALQEARKLGIPIVAVVDSNCDPDDIHFPIPGNDDASRAIQLYCELVSDTVIDGMSQLQSSFGFDQGASADPKLAGEAAKAEAEKKIDAGEADKSKEEAEEKTEIKSKPKTTSKAKKTAKAEAEEKEEKKKKTAKSEKEEKSDN